MGHRRILTRGQYVAWRAARFFGRVLIFGTLTFLAVTALLAWLK